MREDDDTARPILQRIERESREAQPMATDPKAAHLLLAGSREIASILKELPQTLVSQTLSDLHAERLLRVANAFGEVGKTDAPEFIRMAAHGWHSDLLMLLD
jgi:hypothetical protein